MQGYCNLCYHYKVPLRKQVKMTHTEIHWIANDVGEKKFMKYLFLNTDKCIISSSNIILTNSIFKKYAKQKECLCIFPRLLTKILLLIFKYTLLPKSTFLFPSFMCPEKKCILKIRKLIRLSTEMQERKTIFFN